MFLAKELAFIGIHSGEEGDWYHLGTKRTMWKRVTQSVAELAGHAGDLQCHRTALLRLKI